MNIDQFIKGFEQSAEIIEFTVSERFPAFKLKAISASKDKELRAESTRKTGTKNRAGGFEENFNSSLYMDKMIIETVVEPNFKNAELQDRLKVMGAEGVLNLLTAGEYMGLLTEVSKINGFGADAQKEKAEEVKN